MVGRDERRFPLWAPWAAGLLGGALVVGVQMGPVRAHVEDDLTARSVEALAAAGHTGLGVDFTGRDGVVSGVPVSAAADVERIVRGLDGVRTVTVVPQADGAQASPTAPPGSGTSADPGAPSAEPSPSLTQPDVSPTPTPSVTPGATAADQLAALPPVVFDPETSILSPGSGEVIDQIAAIILAGSNVTTYEVQGHTDATGNPAGNLQISRQRAEVVLSALLARGVPLAQLEAVGYGQTRPLVDPEVTEADREANRRVVVVITGTLG